MKNDDIQREKELLNNNIKLKKSKSQFANNTKNINFEELADMKFADAQEKKRIVTELGLKFLKIINDTTIPENQDVFFKNQEKEVIAKLIQLCVDLNNDEDELEGMGSTMLLTLLIRIISKQRDTINKLQYTNSNLQNLISGIIERLDLLENDRLHKIEQSIQNLNNNLNNMILNTNKY